MSLGSNSFPSIIIPDTSLRPYIISEHGTTPLQPFTSSCIPLPPLEGLVISMCRYPNPNSNGRIRKHKI
ncbi:hypothetical protein, unlikely [Trypanosoma brucei brucei TREU927]|uniref:Uncharacterized protein n=1 Tax=Trypanosoma brucei brucei (strain 927/4 GUTat10.1) TaxID=185431 RepID=Q38G12_TRYB2|nr:hypothetical protein, unlikely [Trypanosoma brucei brucei TREU927]EAN76258.1 hypothetical protein, unlikely [Trypanosoma brucei brucei TREU927]